MDERTFLHGLIASQAEVTIFLINGIKLVGVLKGHDQTCLFLTGRGSVQIIYKNAVSTIVPPPGDEDASF